MKVFEVGISVRTKLYFTKLMVLETNVGCDYDIIRKGTIGHGRGSL
jgi:hypothetical protein